MNNFQFVIEPRFNFVGDNFVAGGKFFIAETAQIFSVGFTSGQREFGHLKFSKLNRDVATVSNFQSVIASFGHVGKKFSHLRGGLQIIIVGIKSHAVLVANRLAGLNAKQQVMKFAIFAAYVMGIVRCHERDIKFFGKIFQRVINYPFLLQPVVLYLQKKIIPPKNVNVLPNQILDLLRRAFANSAGNFSRNASTQRDKSFMIFAQALLVNARAIIKAVCTRQRRQLYQIFVARIVFGKQYQMKIFNAVIFFTVEARTWRNVNFTADNRFNAALPCRLVKINDAVHCAVVGYGKGSHSEIFRRVEQVVNPCRAVE